MSGSQAPLGTQGTSRISGISGIRIRDGGTSTYQALSLISLIQHSGNRGPDGGGQGISWSVDPDTGLVSIGIVRGVFPHAMGVASDTA
jgi:hypothetical protein